MVAPALVVALRLAAETPALGAAIGRCFGIALLALGLACWPGRPGSATGAARPAMLAYNALKLFECGMMP